VKLPINQKYYSIYLVAAIISACFIFMFVSTVAVLNTIGGGKTSADLALKDAKQNCDKQKGELVRLNEHNPLYTACIVNGQKTDSKN